MKICNGIDIVNVARFKKIIEKHGSLSVKNKFLQKIFSEDELKFILKRKDPVKTLAGRFAAKEAAVKAFSKVIRLVAYNEILILNDIPEIVFAKPESIPAHESVDVSISHDGAYAISVVTLLLS